MANSGGTIPIYPPQPSWNKKYAYPYVLDLCSPTREAVSTNTMESAMASPPNQTNIQKIRPASFMVFLLSTWD